MKLSLCIATFNEEKNIHYPLDSAYDLVDEVIIVDGGSTDRTVEVAKSYGKKVKIIVSENPIMFHKNKQKAIETARGEWILQLDADEELSEDLKEEIKDIIGQSQIESDKIRKNNTDSIRLNPISSGSIFVAYWIPRKNFFLTRFLMKGGQYPDYTIRLYRNGYAKFPCKDVHENVEIIQKSKVKNSSFAKASEDKQNLNSKLKSEEDVIPAEAGIQTPNNEAIGYLKNPLLHYADPDFSRYLMRWDRYTSLEVEKMIKENPSYLLSPISYLFWKPFSTFFMMYFRHKGFMDGFPGFVFALFSSIRFWVIYIKWWALISKTSLSLTR